MTQEQQHEALRLAGMYPQLPRATMFATVLDGGFAIGNIGVYTPDQMRAYADATCTAREPLRKRECLHQITEPDHFRGATKMVQASEPVVLPEPDAVLRFERSTAGKENEMPIVVSCNWLPDGEYKLYTEQQVRAMLAAEPKPPARKPLRCSCHTCWPIAADDPASTFMRLCPACGNKRCPKANDHRHACTGSNEPGQPGSAYQLTGGITAARKGDAPK